jgi:hypothetical protein
MEEAYDDFVQDYSDRLDDIRRADWRNFPRALSDWLLLVDQSPHSAELVRDLGSRVDFDTWYAQAKASVGGMVGSGRLNWSADRTERLAQTLGLIRQLSSNENELVEYTSAFSWAGSNLNDNKYKVTDEVVEPFARDLFRYIERNRQSVPTLPAADRIVPVSHNSPEVRDLEGKLSELLAAVERSNSLRNDPDFERNLAELSAGKRLLQADAVRPSALGAVLGPALKWFGDHVAGSAIGITITAVAVILAAHFGIVIPGLG